MMKFFKTLFSSLIGTTTMTLYSYAVGKLKKKPFEEPDLLHILLQRGWRIGPGKKEEGGSRLDGWLLHYGAGLFFSIVYDRIWNKSKVTPTIPVGIALGAVSGLAGISIWSLVFNLHPDPPEVETKDLYKHLLAAHILFGLFTALGYRVSGDVEDRIVEREGRLEGASIITN